ncbi:SGNH/GDSL hydrolase family protein [Saccharopolyspora phatthalungensis]|uniref:Lysophospholipase L1-like esterase n=1 Tax=Saccharopolyspora phatthalungensis TaxID=664693 RepID=A0A840PYX0_9PSEU|nr:SGNH/GDSL hydrolase family protein [Saccharopolyspora phatthalungensis]MBB5153496.1 lysophospholipase L1-like esterase [Saccharopolyspora phatthalungensis]
MIAARALRLALLAAGTAGGLSGAAYGLLNGQSRYARWVIGPPANDPLRADGIHLPSGIGPVLRRELVDDVEPLEFAVLGDSAAAGLGVDLPAELPGVRLARGLAEELDRPVELTTHAIVGTTSQELAAQVDAALVRPPELVLIIIGANDVTSMLPVSACADLLGQAVRRLVEAGVTVVVGTCPDLGAIRPIPQPLRSIARHWSLALGRAQRRVVDAAGGRALPLADLLSPEFLARPGEFFSPDRYHPSAAGYEAATTILLPAMCAAIGEWEGGPLPPAPIRSEAAEARRPTSRIVARLNRRLHRRADS